MSFRILSLLLTMAFVVGCGEQPDSDAHKLHHLRWVELSREHAELSARVDAFDKRVKALENPPLEPTPADPELPPCPPEKSVPKK